MVATVGVGTCPYGVAITPDGTRAYVTNFCSNSVSVIDTRATRWLPRSGLGRVSRGVAITPDGTRAYVTNPGSNSVSVIDTASNTVVATVGVGNEPGGGHHPGSWPANQQGSVQEGRLENLHRPAEIHEPR